MLFVRSWSPWQERHYWQLYTHHLLLQLNLQGFRRLLVAWKAILPSFWSQIKQAFVPSRNVFVRHLLLTILFLSWPEVELSVTFFQEYLFPYQPVCWKYLQSNALLGSSKFRFAERDISRRCSQRHSSWRLQVKSKLTTILSWWLQWKWIETTSLWCFMNYSSSKFLTWWWRMISNGCVEGVQGSQAAVQLWCFALPDWLAGAVLYSFIILHILLMVDWVTLITRNAAIKFHFTLPPHDHVLPAHMWLQLLRSWVRRSADESHCEWTLCSIKCKWRMA